MRRAVTYLQSSYNLTAATITASALGKGRKQKKVVESDGDEEMPDAAAPSDCPIITLRTVEEVAGVISPAAINGLVEAMQPPKRGTNYDSLSKYVTDMIADGWSANQVLNQLYDVLLADEMLHTSRKMKLLTIFSEVDKNLTDGSDEHLAILDLALRISQLLAPPT